MNRCSRPGRPAAIADRMVPASIPREAARSSTAERRYEAATPAHVENVRRLVLDALTAAQKRQLRAIARRILLAVRERDGPPG